MADFFLITIKAKEIKAILVDSLGYQGFDMPMDFEIAILISGRD